MNILEIACFNRESALIAASAGADRIELCTNYAAGGLTPSIADFLYVKKKVNIPIYVMIRPHDNGFRYSEEDIRNMKLSINAFRYEGADGFVFGCLDSENKVDELTNEKLRHAAFGLPCTFHRAFDKVDNYLHGLERLLELEFTALLSSGAQKTAILGATRLNELINKASGKLEIIAGGGLRASNLNECKQLVNTRYFHSAALLNAEIADADEVRVMKKILSDVD